MITKAIISTIIRLNRLFLHLYPANFRAEFGHEMQGVFSEKIERSVENGRLHFLIVCLREFNGHIVEGIHQQIISLQAKQFSVVYAGASARMLNRSRHLWPTRSTFLWLMAASGAVLLFITVQNWWYVTLDGTFDVRHVALADLDNDGQLDAFLSIGSLGDGYWRGDRVVLNDSNGRFVDTGQELEEWRSFAAATGDLDHDGSVDVVVGNYNGLILNQNDGSGMFTSLKYWPTQFAHRSSHVNVALADLNGDSHLDVFMTSCCGWQDWQAHYPYSDVWLNDGTGTLVDNKQQIGQVGSNAVALGDLNDDGTVDAFLANGQTIDEYKSPNTVWFNDGQGSFSDSGQRLGQTESLAVVLGDLNDDGFLDAVVGNDGSDTVWFNDGQGNFHNSGQRLGSGLTWSVALADLNGDGSLDLVSGGETSGRIWLNDGTGQFRKGQRIGFDRYASIALGDVTGDGRIDIFAGGVDAYQVWQGLGNGRFAAHKRADYGTANE